MIPRARIVRAPGRDRAQPVLEPSGVAARARRVAREEIDARSNAARVVLDARAEAEALVAEARRQAADAVETVTREAREEASAELVARWLLLREREQAATQREGDRVIAMAVALAERLLGDLLRLDPSRIADLARTVLDETRAARRAVVDAHPLDADELKRQLASGALDLRSFEVRSDETLARGELRLHTDVGTIDARLAPRFDRLAAALRDALE